MPVFVIFVEGTDTEPRKLPVYIVESEEHASLICEGLKESDYQIFDFSFKHCTRSDRGKFAVWTTMICDAREGVYGNIVGGIYKMIDGAYSIMSGRRSREKIASGADTATGDTGSTPSTTTPDEDERRGKNAIPRQLRKRKRKADPKTVKQQEERKSRQQREREIAKDWSKGEWTDYQDYVTWKNENLPAGWSELDRHAVNRAIENVARRARYRKK